MLMSPDEEREEEQKEIGATSALGKITQAGYQSLDVCFVFLPLPESDEPHWGWRGGAT